MFKLVGKKFKLTVVLALIAGSVMFGTGFYQSLSAKTDENLYKDLEVFSEVLDLIKKNYVDEVGSDKLIENAVQGMVDGLDPHSSYLPPDAFKELQVDTKGEFGGIGIVITKKDGKITVISPIEGTPAYSAGIETGDVIIAVDDKITKSMSLWEAVKLMRGPVGEKVKITVLREGEKDFLTFNLERAIIPIKSVKYAELKPGYGYIFISSFKEKTLDELEEAFDALSKEHELKGLILDLRSNPGGLLDQAVGVSDFFIKSGVIVSIKGRNGQNTHEYKANDDGTEGSFPMVVLINGGSASASEIVSGALQDHKRAIIMGTTSFGKGSVQTVRPLRNGAAIKYTIARYYTPSGRSIQAEGIKPDIEIKYVKQDKKKVQDDSKALKEKDLANHLEAEPFKDKKKDKNEKKTELPHSKDIKMDGLKKDNQVQQALNLLVGYHLFIR